MQTLRKVTRVLSPRNLGSGDNVHCCPKPIARVKPQRKLLKFVSHLNIDHYHHNHKNFLDFLNFNHREDTQYNLALLGGVSSVNYIGLKPFLQVASSFFHQVFYIPGMAEYSTPISGPQIHHQLTSICGQFDNIYLLVNDYVMIENISIFGSSLLPENIAEDSRILAQSKFFPNTILLSHFAPSPYITTRLSNSTVKLWLYGEKSDPFIPQPNVKFITNRFDHPGFNPSIYIDMDTHEIINYDI